MGVYLSLEIMPNQISQDEWREAYEESLALLQGYLGEMMGIQHEKIYSSERRVYSRKIEHDADNPDERYWRVVGDFESKRTGESFVYCYDLDHYRSRMRGSENDDAEDDDIIVSIIEEKSNYRSVFSEKTQGQPYHIPLLAVAMLTEDRFPKYAHASGDFDVHQARAAQEFAKTVLKREIALPISVNAPALIKRIYEHYQGKAAIEHFGRIFRGNFNEQFKVLFEISDNVTFTQWFLDELRHYKSPGQLGAIDLIIAWLNVTKDLRTLCELACLSEDGPKFDPVEFSDALPSTWISIDVSLRDVMKAFRKPDGMIDTVNIQFGSVLMDMGGLKGRNIRFYMDEKQVLKILGQLFPAYARQLEDVFKTSTAKIKKDLADSQEGVKEFVRAYEVQPEIGDGESFMLLDSAEKFSEPQKTMLEFMAYALAQARSRILEEYPEISEEPPEQLKNKIVGISNDQGLTFTEDAWKWIDSEKNMELLRLVLYLVMIKNHELTFSNMRRGILENRELCNAVLEMIQDEQVLTGIAEKVSALKEGA